MSEIDLRIQAYLDGELRLEDLPLALRESAEEWDRLLAEVARSAPAGAPSGFDSRVVAAIRKAGPAPGVRNMDPSPDRPAWLDWAIRPRSVRISPIAALGLAAALALVVLRPWTGVDMAPETEPDLLARSVYVQFVVQAEGAESVHLAGDFSEWQPAIALSDPDGDGVWSGRVPLEPGVHEYMFVIDGSEWISDPNAAVSRDDGFGRQNSLLAVTAISGT
ncbi:MAG: glycogen-binding domain-containing protein [marine benthic group bacterium]|nr:glycogen-binding domain-containing protein [Gemmatimonadota bacterium]